MGQKDVAIPFKVILYMAIVNLNTKIAKIIEKLFFYFCLN